MIFDDIDEVSKGKVEEGYVGIIFIGIDIRWEIRDDTRICLLFVEIVCFFHQ